MDEQSLANLREALRVQTEDEHDGVWSENWDTVYAFATVGSQWRVVAIGGGGGGFAPALPSRPFFIGLDYSAVKIALDAEQIVITKELWIGLRIMEAEACAALNGSSD